VSRHGARAVRRPADPSLAYVRDVDTPVVLGDVVDALEVVTQLAESRDDDELARAARHVHALVVSLRSQFVEELTGATAPSETATAPGAPAQPVEDTATRARPPSLAAASNS